MLRIRYFRIRLPKGMPLSRIAERASDHGDGGALAVTKSSASEVILVVTAIRSLNTVQYTVEGDKTIGVVTTMERYSIRLFRSGGHLFLSAIDPPRSGRAVMDVLSQLMPEEAFFVDAVELSRAAIERHVASFESARLVSAKVRDFQIYEKAVARLEITSKEGLLPDIAPILTDRFHRLDSLTYEITHQFKKGLVHYAANGTIRMSPALIDIGFPSFEKQLGLTPG